MNIFSFFLLVSSSFHRTFSHLCPRQWQHLAPCSQKCCLLWWLEDCFSSWFKGKGTRFWRQRMAGGGLEYHPMVWRMPPSTPLKSPPAMKSWRSVKSCVYSPEMSTEIARRIYNVWDIHNNTKRLIKSVFSPPSGPAQADRPDSPCPFTGG